jgi:hypothetical protein
VPVTIVEPILISTPGEPFRSSQLSIQEAALRFAEQYRLLIAPDQVVELRALKVLQRYGRPQTVAGYFDRDHLPDMAEVALEISQSAMGVYFMLNPINPDLLARRCNRIDVAQEGELTKDKNVIARRWLLVDVDPVRDSHISSSDTEKALALDTARNVREFLRGRAWPEPIFADSGNGFHLFYRVDLPAEDGGQVEGVLRALADRFDTDQVKIDRSVFNPARICKLPGTWARKGDSTPTRPHRQAQLLEIPTS